MKYRLCHQDGRARAGLLELGRGVVETPTFMPVGTRASVKTLDSRDIEELRPGIILANTYHLYLRPGLEVLEACGGVHRLMNYNGNILTDSGGFQVFSLAASRKISEEGVIFRSHIDGQLINLTPEESIRAQLVIGSEIAMSFDECPPHDASHRYMADSVARTIRWAERGRAVHEGPGALFGIVQGGLFPDLRKESALGVVSLDFDGYSIGGVSVGETKEEMKMMIDLAIEHLPSDKPRYLMGVGSIDGLLEGIERGVDMFDCVLPTRLARHGAALTSSGRVNIEGASYRFDFSPLDPSCSCRCCREYSRAYLRHLFNVEEDLGKRLVTTHNLHFLLRLVEGARQAIIEGRFADFKTMVYTKYGIRDRHPGF